MILTLDEVTIFKTQQKLDFYGYEEITYKALRDEIFETIVNVQAQSFRKRIVLELGCIRGETHIFRDI